MQHHKVTLGNACWKRESPFSQDAHLPVEGVQDAEEQESLGFTVKCDRHRSTRRVGSFTGLRPRPQAALRWRKKLRRGFTIAGCRRGDLEPTPFVMPAKSSMESNRPLRDNESRIQSSLQKEGSDRTYSQSTNQAGFSFEWAIQMLTRFSDSVDKPPL